MFIHVRAFSAIFFVIPLDLAHFFTYFRDLRYVTTYAVSLNYPRHVLKERININFVSVQVLF